MYFIKILTILFSFIPIFTSDKPHMIFRGSTNQNRRLSLNLIHLIMLDGFTPSNYMLTARYKIFDKKFKLSFGTEFPGGYRVLKNEEYKTPKNQGTKTREKIENIIIKSLLIL